METFQTLILENKRKTWLLVGAIVGLTSVLGAVFLNAIIGGFDPSVALAGFLLAFAGSGLGSLVSFYQGANIVMAVSGARELPPGEDPQLRNVVEELAIAAGVPVPRIYVIDDTALNAFATGRDPRHAAVAITSGLREKLSRDELQSVLAHEMGHVANYDIRLTMLIAVMAGAIVLMCDAFWRVLRFGGGRSNNDRDKSGGAAIVIVFVVALVLAIIAPIVARFLQLAISRQREFLADATAVRLTRNPEALVQALTKLSSDTEPLEAANRATEHLYIVSPTRKLAKANIDSVWSTHPPIIQRIKRIRALTH